MILALILAVQAVASPAAAIADSLFARGDLDAAHDAYARQLALHPDDGVALTRLGMLALWSNRLAEAERLLGAAAAGDPDSREIQGALAEVHYRAGRFVRAAEHLRRLGREAQAAKLEAIGLPNRVTISPAGTRLPFAARALLPVLVAEVNGHQAHLLLDTGAGETILDPAFADRVGARRFGADSAVYAGGRVGTFDHAAVDSLRLGEAVIHGVPARVLSTRAFAPAAGGLPVDGIIGTTLLSQFLSTIDFGGRALELAPRGTGAAEAAITLRFWLLGDHFITASGVAAGVETLLVFDTGLAIPGGAFVPAESLLREAAVVPLGTPVSGVGGGGAVSVTPFRFPRLAMGSLVRTDVMSVAGAFPEVLEHRFGPRIGGLVSHGFFEGRRVTLDFDAMRLIVTESGGPVHTEGGGVAVAAAVPPAITDSLLAARAASVVELLRDRRYDDLGRLWSPALRERLPPENVGASWEGLVAAVGRMVRMESPEVTLDPRQATVPVQFERVRILVGVRFDEAGLVSGITMQGG